MKNDFSEMVDVELELVLQLKDALLPNVENTDISVHHEDGLHYIEFGCYCITPVEAERKTVGGSRFCTEWQLTHYAPTLGSYNEPPDVDEVNYGNCRTASDCVIWIAKQELMQTAHNVIDSYFLCLKQSNEEEKMWQEMDDSLPPIPQACPHGNYFSDCNQCMVDSDLAYDARRER